MKCNSCGGTAYAFRTRTSTDATRRMYRCKVCGNVIRTVEVIGELEKREEVIEMASKRSLITRMYKNLEKIESSQDTLTIDKKITVVSDLCRDFAEFNNLGFTYLADAKTSRMTCAFLAFPVMYEIKYARCPYSKFMVNFELITDLKKAVQLIFKRAGEQMEVNDLLGELIF